MQYENYSRLIDDYHRAESELHVYLIKEGYRITRAHMHVFVCIALDIRNPSDIARKLHITRQAVHQTTDDMVERKWVYFEHVEGDKRAKIICGTMIGQSILSSVRERMGVIEGKLNSELREDQE